MPEFPYEVLLPPLAHLSTMEWALVVSNLILSTVNLAKWRSTNHLTTAVRELLPSKHPLMLNVIQVPAFYVWPFGNYQKGRSGFETDLIFIHGMGGTLTGTDATFRNPRSRVSATFGIGTVNNTNRIEIHQYVQLKDTPFSNGVVGQFYNERCYSIEIQNQNMQGELEVKEEYYVKAAELVFQLCRIMGKRPDASFIVPHKMVRVTECPKGIEVDRIIREAQALWDAHYSSSIDQSVANAPQGIQASATKVAVKYAGRVTATYGVKVRPDPSTRNPALRVMTKDQGFWYLATVKGESIAGNDTWVLLEDHRYVWSGAVSTNQ